MSTDADRSPALSAAQSALLRHRLGRRQPSATAATRIVPGAADAEPQLSFAQERVWFMEQYAPGTAAYLTPVAVRLRGRLDRTALQQALNALITRHETLRTCFPAGPDGQPVAEVAALAELPIELVPATSHDEAHDRLRAATTRPFDLGTGPLLRALLSPLTEEDHLLVLAGHHIVADGWSSDVLVGDLLTFYRGALTGAATGAATGAVTGPADLPIRYRDFVRWQRAQIAGPGAERHRRYWRRQLAAVPVLELPTDRPRPALQGFDGASHRFRIDAALCEAVLDLATGHGATPFMVLLAAFQTLLGRHSRQQDFAVGSPVAGRTRPETEPLVGMFVNMLALRADLEDDPPFLELLARTRRSVLDGLSHQELPFEQVVADLGGPRETSRSPLFQVTFGLHNFVMRHARREPRPAGEADLRTGDGAGDPAQLSAGWQPLELPATRFDLELQAVIEGDELAFTFVYNTALFEPATVRRWAQQFELLLGSIVAGPRTRLSRFGLLPPAERELVTRTWNDTFDPVPAEDTITSLVEAQARRSPDAIAVGGDAGKLSYRELNRRANQVAHRLRGAGAGPETLVAVCVERSLELVVGLLGVLKSGAAYVPLDPAHPPERLSYLIEDCAATLLLTQQHLSGSLPDGAGTEVLLLDHPADWVDQPDHDPEPVATAANPAYLIYTSGSTGRPKGVLNTHAAICNRLHDLQRSHPLSRADAVLQKTPSGFDVAVWEVFWPLLAGARLVLARPGGHQDPSYLRDLIIDAGITVAHFVPSMLAMFADEPGVGGCSSLRLVMSGGEALPPPVAAQFGSRLPGVALFNLYGPAEAAVDVSAWNYDPATLGDATGVPIGRPLRNTRLYVLDAALAPLPIGVDGELCIGGTQVGRGYWRRPGLTADRFVPDPYGPPGARLYRTGDLARWTTDGVLEFQGRADSQVKLRGQRVELGEIESRLREHPSARDAVVIMREDAPGDQRLVAYVVPAGAADDEFVAALRSALRRALPDYMVPAAFVALDALPLNPNGKLDRAALPAPEPAAGSGRRYVAPRNASEELVARIWADVLGIEQIGADDDFFELGGHSLLAVRVVARLRPELAGTGRSVGVMDVFSHRTLAELGALVAGQDADRPRRLLYELTGPVPVTERVRSYVALPYGGGSAAVYQPLADALPAGQSLYALAIPGHDVGLDEAALPFAELARRTTEEVLATVEGPLVLYGHCGVGGALVVEVARRLEQAGRELDAVYIGAIFPFARTQGRLSRLQAWLERRSSDRHYTNWLKSGGVDLEELDPDQAERIVGNMRGDSRQAEAYFGELLQRRAQRLRAPVISVIGERDPSTLYYQERYREWQFLSGISALVVLDEAGHFFLKFRARELAEIVTATHPAVVAGDVDALRPAARPGGTWWLHGIHRTEEETAGTAPGGAAADADRVRPAMRRFAAVAAGQLVSMTGSALTSWAIPVWIFLHTGSLAQFALFAVSGLIPTLLISPLAGAVVDRADRRTVMVLSGVAAGGVQLVLGLLYWAGRLQTWHLYTAIALVSSALAFQRLAFTSAIPQLVPKTHLGNANGVAQLTTGFATLLVPLFAAGALATIGLGRILLLDVVSYAIALAVLAVVRFPDTMGWRPREPLLTEVANGWRYSWGNPGLRALLLFSAMINVFIGPALILVSPLVLSFGSIGQVGEVSFAQALGGFVGGLTFTVWGGPGRRRMRGLLLITFALAGSCLITGLRPSVLVVAVGVFGTGLCLTVIGSIYATIVQVKVPQRFHGRVFALNQMIAWSTLPLGFAVIAPLAASTFGPLLTPHGALAGSVGTVIGVGDGRGIGLVYVVAALVVTALTVTALCRSVLSRFDTDVPDALADDLVGIQALTGRTSQG